MNVVGMNFDTENIPVFTTLERITKEQVNQIIQRYNMQSSVLQIEELYNLDFEYGIVSVVVDIEISVEHILKQEEKEVYYKEGETIDSYLVYSPKLSLAVFFLVSK